MPNMLTNIVLALLLLGSAGFGLLQASAPVWSLDVIILAGTTTVFVGLILARPAPRSADQRWWVWLLCAASSLYVLAFEEKPDVVNGTIDRIAYWGRLAFQTAGSLSLISLGRSLALLPAVREVHASYAYAVVRHPVYTFYMLADVMFLTLQFTWWNLAVSWTAVLLFVWRASLEEDLLVSEEAYRAYQQQVPWRFVPYVI
jgi:protein-S-isoprenylcysteine O-methyltransferase Ste14